MLNLLIPFFGSVPPPAPPVVAAITLNPAAPGDLGVAPAVWTTRVTATGGLTQVKWTVGVPGAKTITFPMGVPNNITVPTYNHGDVIDFTGYGTGFALIKDASGPNMFYASGSLGSDTFAIGSEINVADIRYTINGAGGTGPLTNTIINLVNGEADIQATFNRAGDTLIVKSVDETVSVNTSGVVFSGPVVRSIALVPAGPGDLINAPATWTTRVNAVGLTQVQWIVLDSNWIGSGTTEFTVVNLVNGTALITCNFLKPGDRLVVKSLDLTVETVSTQVIFTGGARSLSMNPINPGNLGTAPQTWETTVTAYNQSSFEWAIRGADGAIMGNWFVANVVNNTAIIRPTFTAANQKLVISTPDNAVRQESGAVSFGTVVTPTPGGAGYQLARDFVKNLTVGVNLERGTGLGLGQSYFDRMKRESNITHIRHFAPTRIDWNSFTSEAGINGFADSCQQAIAAGLKATFACLDVTALEHLDDQRIKDHVKMCARVFKARNFDPRYFAIGAWNELAHWTDDNSASNGYRREFYNYLRTEMPNHLIVLGAANWGAWQATVNPSLEILPDKQVLYEWHSYPFDAQNIGVMQGIQSELNAFANAHGVVSINGELAQAGETGGLDPATIPGVIYASSRGAWQQRNTYWTITGGSYFRMNISASDFNLEASQAAALREADAYIRAQPGFGT